MRRTGGSILESLLPETCILDIFEGLQRHELIADDGKIQQRFPPKLTDLQRDLMSMMSVPKRAYPGT